MYILQKQDQKKNQCLFLVTPWIYLVTELQITRFYLYDWMLLEDYHKFCVMQQTAQILSHLCYLLTGSILIATKVFIAF